MASTLIFFDKAPNNIPLGPNEIAAVKTAVFRAFTTSAVAATASSQDSSEPSSNHNAGGGTIRLEVDIVDKNTNGKVIPSLVSEISPNGFYYQVPTVAGKTLFGSVEVFSIKVIKCASPVPAPDTNNKQKSKSFLGGQNGTTPPPPQVVTSSALTSPVGVGTPVLQPPPLPFDDIPPQVDVLKLQQQKRKFYETQEQQSSMREHQLYFVILGLILAATAALVSDDKTCCGVRWLFFTAIIVTLIGIFGVALASWLNFSAHNKCLEAAEKGSNKKKWSLVAVLHVFFHLILETTVLLIFLGICLYARELHSGIGQCEACHG